jgi:hypothetical protein
VIQTHDDYHFVGGDDFHEIIVNGGIMPLRSNPMTLRGEDIVFLQEALSERQYATGDVTTLPEVEEDAKVPFTRKLSAHQLNMIIRGFRDLDDVDYLISGSKLTSAKFDVIPAGNRLREIIDVSRTSRLDLPDEVSPGDKCRAAAIQQLLAAANDTKWAEVGIQYDHTRRQGKMTGAVIPSGAPSILTAGTYSRRSFMTHATKIEYSDAGALSSVGDYKTTDDYLLNDSGEQIYLQVGNSWFLANQYLEVWGLLSAERERRVTYPPMYSSGGLPPYQSAEHLTATSCKLVRLTSGSSDYSGYRWVVGTSTLKSHFDELAADVGFSRSIPSMASTVRDYVYCGVLGFYFVLRLDRTSY